MQRILYVMRCNKASINYMLIIKNIKYEEKYVSLLQASLIAQQLQNNNNSVRQLSGYMLVK